MRMPEGEADSRFFAPCGMNCLVCYRHCRHPKPCPGCRAEDGAKPAHCRSCAIPICAGEKGAESCHACAAFPCGRIRSLDKRYRLRHGISLIGNSQVVRAQGLAAFMEQQKVAFTCPECGGECDAAELIALYEDVRAGYVSDAESVGLWIEKLDAMRVA